jgi:hypothetical protein
MTIDQPRLAPASSKTDMIERRQLDRSSLEQNAGIRSHRCDPISVEFTKQLPSRIRDSTAGVCTRTAIGLRGRLQCHERIYAEPTFEIVLIYETSRRWPSMGLSWAAIAAAARFAFTGMEEAILPRLTHGSCRSKQIPA